MSLNDLKQELLASGNPEKAVQMKAYMKDQFSFLGIQTPLRKEICKPYFKEEKKQEGVDWVFVDDCWASEFRELQYAALNYLRLKQAKLSPQDLPRLKKLALTKSWWDTVDELDGIIGAIALKNPELNEVLLEWSVDDNFWLRRIAINFQLQYKEKTNIQLLEDIIVNNLGQKEFFITKAIGWSLRAYSKTNPEWVRAFLEKYQSQMAPLSIKEGSKYI